MSTPAGFKRPGLECVHCHEAFFLFLAVKNLVRIEDLSDPFLAKCPMCDHEATYPKSAIHILVAAGRP